VISRLSMHTSPCERPTVYNVRGDTLMTTNGGMENGSAWPGQRFGSLDVLADVPHELPRKSGTEVKTPRAMTSRSIRANHSSTWLSQDE
jgi:hypothetical protein